MVIDLQMEHIAVIMYYIFNYSAYLPTHIITHQWMINIKPFMLAHPFFTTLRLTHTNRQEVKKYPTLNISFPLGKYRFMIIEFTMDNTEVNLSTFF